MPNKRRRTFAPGWKSRPVILPTSRAPIPTTPVRPATAVIWAGCGLNSCQWNWARQRASFRPGVIKQWLGDSVGWYEGASLVVETRNVHPQQRGFISKDGVLTERFSRWDDKQIVYEFTVDDPSQYAQAWKGEMAFNLSAEPSYEYACHEGNYAMEGILAGARAQERAGGTVAANADEE